MDKSKSSIEIWIAIAALAVSIGSISFSTCWHYDQKKSIKQLQGTQNRPLLVTVNSPEINKNIKFGVPEMEEDLLYLPFELKLEITITLKNQGTSIAELIAWAVTDRSSGEPSIRREILDAEKRKKWKFNKSADFYKTITIIPNGDHPFDFTHSIKNINEEREFTLHFWFLYKDELGNLYDSYYWARYISEEIDFPMNKEKKIQIDRSIIDRFFQFVDNYFDTKMYIGKEAETLSSILKDIQLEQDNE